MSYDPALDPSNPNLAKGPQGPVAKYYPAPPPPSVSSYPSYPPTPPTSAEETFAKAHSGWEGKMMSTTSMITIPIRIVGWFDDGTNGRGILVELFGGYLSMSHVIGSEYHLTESSKTSGRMDILDLATVQSVSLNPPWASPPQPSTPLTLQTAPPPQHILAQAAAISNTIKGILAGIPGFDTKFNSIAPIQARDSNYPHVCPRCASPAYVGAVPSAVSCTNRDCKFFEKK